MSVSPDPFIFQLEDTCFTVLCWFLLYNNVYGYKYTCTSYVGKKKPISCSVMSDSFWPHGDLPDTGIKPGSLSAIRMHMCPPSWPSLCSPRPWLRSYPSTLPEHWAGLPVLNSSFPLAVTRTLKQRMIKKPTSFMNMAIKILNQTWANPIGTCIKMITLDNNSSREQMNLCSEIISLCVFICCEPRHQSEPKRKRNCAATALFTHKPHSAGIFQW